MANKLCPPGAFPSVASLGAGGRPLCALGCRGHGFRLPGTCPDSHAVGPSMHVGTWSEQRHSQAPVSFSGSALGPFATVLRKLKCLVLNIYTEERSLDFGSFPCSRCKSFSAGRGQEETQWIGLAGLPHPLLSPHQPPGCWSEALLSTLPTHVWILGGVTES